MNDHWIEGRFEGTYEGRRLATAELDEAARRFSFRLRSGAVRDAEIVDGPFADSTPPGEPHEIRQDRVGDISLSVAALDLERHDTSLFDVRIVDWRLSRPAEAKGRSFGRIEGRLRARLLPPRPEPIGDEAATHGAIAGADTSAAPVVEPPSLSPPRRAPSPAGAIASSRAAQVVGPDARDVYARLVWWAAVALASCVAVALWVGCGGTVACAWAGTTLPALCIRRLARSAIHAGSARQGWLAASLVLTQAALLLEPLAAGGAPLCATPSTTALAGFSIAVLGAALLRGRTALLACSVVYLAAMLSWCNAAGGVCAPGATPAMAVRPGATSPNQAAPRTSPDGHWPRMPGRGADGRGGSNATGRGGVFELGTSGTAAAPTSLGEATQVAAFGADSSEDGGAAFGSDTSTTDARSPGAGDGARSRARSAPSVGDDPIAVFAGSESNPATDLERVDTRGGAGGSTRGGWVAAAHRDAMAGAPLISLEHANRVPAAFYGSNGQRRVYVPTDAIFEPGGADIRATGALALGRIAALLQIDTDARTRLVVHTDAGGSLDAMQSLSERRAASIRRWLMDRGHVDVHRFDVAGAGGAHPLVPPDGSYAAQQPNRRIEISLLD